MQELIGTTLGGYELLEAIGSGGMASVYKAHDVANNRTVAVKVLTPQLAILPNFKSRFEREARVLQGLKHPNIVPILAFGEDQGFLYIVMPFMDHGSLADRLRTSNLTVKEGARIIGHVASALQFAHEAGVVHRDVKPSNILIDDDDNVWLSDFGFAHVRDSTISLTGSAVIGTPAYMAPEQIRGEGVTTASDLYSLGVVLYQISTGKLPYDADTPIAIAVKHATESLPRPRAVNPNLPDNVEAVLVKALAKDPKDRFRSIAEFNDAFQEALIEAVDPSTGRLRPGAITPGPVTLEMDTALMEKFAPKRPSRRRRYAWAALVLLLLLATPLAAWSMTNLFNSSSDALALAAGSATEDLRATIEALNTQVAGNPNAPAGEEARETTVAGTLTSLKATDSAGDGLLLVKPSATTTGTVTLGGGAGTPIATSSGSGSLTTDEPTSPPAASVTPAPSATSSEQPTAGPSPTSSRTFTPGPSPTPTWTSVFSPTPTWTSPPPSATSSLPSPTHTLVPTATDTLEPTSPPPPTATENVCASVSVSWKNTQGNTARFTFSNGSGSSVSINSMNLGWPAGNEFLKQAQIAGTTVWNGQDDASPTSMSGFSKSVGPGSSAGIVFTFKKAAVSSGYNLTVRTANGCQDSASH